MNRYSVWPALVVMLVASECTPPRGRMTEVEPVAIELPYPSALCDSTVEEVVDLLNKGHLDIVKRLVAQAPEATHQKERGYITASYLLSLMRAAGEHYHQQRYAEALDTLQSFWRWRTARAHLINLVDTPYEQSAWSAFGNAETVSKMLQNYLLVYQYGRYTGAWYSGTDEDAEWVAKALLRFPSNEVSDTYFFMEMCDGSIDRYDIGPVYNLYSRHVYQGYGSACDSAFAGLDTGFSSASVYTVLPVCLRHLSGSYFERDSVVMHFYDRPYGVFREGLRELIVGVWGSALYFYASQTSREFWFDVLERLSGERVELNQGPITVYNPRVLAWALENLVPPPQHMVCSVSTGELYTKIFATAVRLPALCLQELVKRGLQQEVQAYALAMRSLDFDGREYVHARYGDMAIKGYPGSAYQEQIMGYAGFWIRRGLSGNMGEIRDVYLQFLERYDKVFVKTLRL